MNDRTPVLVGCSGWAGSQTQYVSQFPVVEIQSTFYDPPAAKVASRWREISPAGFEICIKAWQLVTHTPSSPTYRRLRQPIDPTRRAFFGSFQDTDEVWQAWMKTLEVAEAAHATVVLFQCPASLKPDQRNVENLSRFFQKIGPQVFRLAWEPRGTWPREVVREICLNHNVIHCVDPLNNNPDHQNVLYWRLHGKGSYSYTYTDEDLGELCNLLVSDRCREKAYIFFNNLSMKKDAERFQLLLDRFQR